ncbi:MAG: hypothetical protein CVV44_17965 [Spirochaetae bacterium HGW-Spirochaetae-1]|jgi:rare lipoprotein A|nr:MAG: hypothetical protein CVV44_17965 [Spirochaetae bacterium HGW-Spirochaetae-1]
MNKMLKGMATVIMIVFAMVILTGCTPGKTQLKKTVNNNNQQREYAKVDELGFDEENSSFGDDMPVVNESSVDKGKNNDYDDPDASARSRQDSEKYFQKGLASWYGREFHGKITASGERFNMNEYTAAHRTLPFGTIVQVKNLENGKTVKVKINDRGPYKGNRIIDLSYNAARSLEIVRQGQGMVEITILKKGMENPRDNAYIQDQKANSNVEPVVDEYYDNDKSGRDQYSGTGSGNLSLQAGAFYSRRNADKLKEKIESLTNLSVIVESDGDMHKVRINGVLDRREANKLKKILANENIPSFIIE